MKRLISVVTMVCYLSACTGWKTTPVAPETAKVLRLTLQDGKRLQVYDAQVVGDSIVGFGTGDWVKGERVRVAYANAGVAKVEQRGTSTSLTVLALVGVAAVAGFVVWALTLNPVDPDH